MPPPGSLKPLAPQKLSKSVRITITIVVSVTVVIGGTTLGLKISSSVSGHSSDSSSQSGGEPLSVQASFNRTAAALTANGYGGYLVPSFDNNCVTHSYGKVQSFFQLHPCRWLARAYAVIREYKQDPMLVAISWVDMPTSSLAEQYKSLVDKPGTGNITELSRETGPYQKVVFNGNYYLSGVIGTAVWNVQVQPIGSVPVNVIDKVLNDSRQ